MYDSFSEILTSIPRSDRESRSAQTQPDIRSQLSHRETKQLEITRVDLAGHSEATGAAS